MNSGLVVIGEGSLEIWGESPRARARRAFARVGIDQVLDEGEAARFEGHLILVRADAVLDAPIVAALAQTKDVILRSTGPDAGISLAAHVPASLFQMTRETLLGSRSEPLDHGIVAMTSENLAASYWRALRKKETPYALIVTAETRRSLEWRMFMGTYKGATDFVTKWVWPRPAFLVTKFCARVGMTPNFVTAVSLVLVLAALYWFYRGNWFAGLSAAWAMTFLDTVDGKLARVTLTSSKIGNVFDHSIDLIHPPFWYIAWSLGLGWDEFNLVLVVIVAGYILQRAIEGLSIALFKIEIHVWRRIDTWFRQFTARRNPNLVLLTAGVLAGRPDLGLIAVAVWTAISLVLHVVQMLQAAAIWRRDGRLLSWMAKSDGQP